MKNFIKKYFMGGGDLGINNEKIDTSYTNIPLNVVSTPEKLNTKIETNSFIPLDFSPLLKHFNFLKFDNDQINNMIRIMDEIGRKDPSKRLSKEQLAALLANAHWESGFQPFADNRLKKFYGFFQNSYSQCYDNFNWPTQLNLSKLLKQTATPEILLEYVLDDLNHPMDISWPNYTYKVGNNYAKVNLDIYIRGHLPLYYKGKRVKRRNSLDRTGYRIWHNPNASVVDLTKAFSNHYERHGHPYETELRVASAKIIFNIMNHQSWSLGLTNRELTHLRNAENRRLQ